MDRRRVAFWLWTAAALAGGLGLRLWFISHSATIAGDTLIYGAIAKNWMEQGVYGFSQTAGVAQPTLIRLPGYPLFLIACFRVFGVEHYTAAMYIQGIIDLLSCLLLSALAGRLFGRRARVATLWLAVLCPFTASYVAAPLTETLTLTCIVVAFYGLERWRAAGFGYNRWLWVVAATLSYAILLRPEQGLLAAAVVPAMLWMVLRLHGHRGWVRAAVPVVVASVCVLLPLVPWTAANQLGRDWCAQGADVEFHTNEEPPFLNKLVVNHALPMLVDGEPAMQWIAGRFNGQPSTPNCGEF